MSETVIVGRRPRRRPRLQLLGIGLAGYGITGLVLLVLIALAINRPLERAQQLSASVEAQRVALIDALDQAEVTIDQMAAGVGRMDTSLADAKAVTDRAAAIAHGVAASMFRLRDAMALTIFGAQPLIGLAAGFDQSGQQLDLLGVDMRTIGAALEVNRADVVTTATNLTQLAVSVGTLTTAVREGPSVDISTATLDAVRLAVYAIAAWLGVFAVGCVIAGLYVIVLGSRPGHQR